MQSREVHTFWMRRHSRARPTTGRRLRRIDMPATTTTMRLDRTEIQERISRLPRVKLAFTPTPLEEVPRLAKELGGPRIFFKREDLTGFAFGGNKVRAMEFRLGHVLANGYDAF